MSDDSSLTLYAEPLPGRACRGCKACCIQVPVAGHELNKPANVRCRHLTSKGCGIYSRRPEPCRVWSCRWLFDPLTAGMRRPDHAGYVIDPMPDRVLYNGEPWNVFQVWVDPARRDAHRDPALRAWVEAMGRRYNAPTMIRFSQDEGFMLIPPFMCDDGQWHELTGTMMTQAEIDDLLDAVS